MGVLVKTTTLPRLQRWRSFCEFLGLAAQAKICQRFAPKAAEEASPCRPIAASPYRRVALSPYRRVAVSPYRRIAVSPHRPIAVSPYRRIAASPYPDRPFAVSPIHRGRLPIARVRHTVLRVGPVKD
jgi:hypothetical protein